MKHFASFLQTMFLAGIFCVLFPGIASAHTSIMHQQQQREIMHIQRAHDTDVYVWATDVFVRSCASKSCGPLDQISRTNVSDVCQRQAEVVTDAGYTNNWWSYIRTPGGIYGWISNIYIKGDAVIGGVPFC